MESIDFSEVLKSWLLTGILMDVKDYSFSKITTVIMTWSIAFLNVYSSWKRNLQRIREEKFSYVIKHYKLQ